MNRKHKNFIGMLVGVLALLSTLSFPCFAEGTTTIHMSADSLSVGDTLSVTVTASESGSISLRYNADVLQFAGSSASYTTDGNTITFEGTSATLQFTAASQGQSSLIVSSDHHRKFCFRTGCRRHWGYEYTADPGYTGYCDTGGRRTVCH
ncbi:hypothetical protein DW996_11465 [Roseburia sp. AM51-8]|uniref:hypothetical protein n=1 Tax=Roseburia sp. AM51-8 TaxID=2292366 RepID=UPI000E470057|nr:hypothetical protein [Roseburia sp. AM51-8]RHP99261.1 hypothetical protein DW996_11465 [Roseburia sp. AM51-8]